MIRDRIEQFNGEHMGLAWSFQVNPNSCGNHDHYEQYIRLVAIGDKIAGRGTTHVYIREEDGMERILGYITLRATSYIKYIEDVPHGNPALEIFELAVSSDTEGEGVGTQLVKFAFAAALEINTNYMGVRYITLCADELAVPFYKKFGFGKVEEYGEIPREHWNQHCIPMFLKLPDLPV